ncbi:aminotransferase class I/II-fold pyridoxal phosphate-dependent enzyme [Plebeiibacterium marinum]|uniref:Aminotransferase class I/II-fold pyridoxal phosphate-dependent enzyme n=1 Tax=Plebeiibacterium marinum TaxID=2992111 RepID=A0AAE3MH25_9BACT|nr:aminotransferase class I/II-fold pyridoxal phosphate-dependent enzyme [Plebeiobacterium marinum]MCW3807581.1 aminotransferase class I/II-fold pyridoxal phosphate-dependent enzyme [Plebeiobacterium marinum]
MEKLSSPKDIAAYAREVDLINMAENFSMQKSAPELTDLLHSYIKPFANESSPKFGLLELREAIALKTESLYDFKYAPDTEVTVTNGVKPCVFAIMLALLKEGDEVIVFEPAHKSYQAAINVTGARVVYVELDAPEFSYDWEKVQKFVTSKTRMIIINSPHFPTGTTMSELDMLRLQKIINGTNIYILSDESFEHIVFDKEMHQSIALYPKLRERSIIVSSFNETLGINNWHIAYCLSTEKIMKSIRGVISLLGEGVGIPYQKAIVSYLNKHSDFAKLAGFYQKKRDLLLEGLDDSGVFFVPSKSSYYQLISKAGKNDSTDVDFAMSLIKDVGIAAVPLSYYYHQKIKTKFVRLNFSLPDEDLIKANQFLKGI